MDIVPGLSGSNGKLFQPPHNLAPTMRILIVHNYYQHRGGEALVFEDEARLLEAHGHEVLRYTTHNDRVNDINTLSLAAKTIWNNSSYHDLRALIRETRPELMHVHNTLPLISPAAYYAADRENISIVQSLHNYRLLCPVGLFYRKGKVCEKCLGKKIAWPGVAHACYRDSRAATGAITAMTALHGAARTWTGKVSRYIALTRFARNKFIEGGLPSEKIAVKPHFVSPDPGRRDGDENYLLYVGRLGQGKGVDILLEAWQQAQPDLLLKVAGDGPLTSAVERAAREQSNVEYLGHLPSEEVYELMGAARMLIVPSKLYETFGRVVIEAFAVGTPVIASNIGALAELIEHGRTGRLFEPGNASDLAKQISWTLDHRTHVQQMRDEVRHEYEKHYTAERNYELLLDIYASA